MKANRLPKVRAWAYKSSNAMGDLHAPRCHPTQGERFVFQLFGHASHLIAKVTIYARGLRRRLTTEVLDRQGPQYGSIRDCTSMV
jgi:hypothetical protein